ncbi:Ribosomal lysine N-methyltransferase 4 [Mycena indigotica]|uniref:Ribosomal lysine N-methyltransferase 4 n=1 Tax=Mycena indigotica TaxID=2126181 RepID=A0A8H6WEN6_9AGAR|nr:Ribosomal lysine N-methyltransferase 4 [Mycena indigotica]KAF7315884.1 Ribosomal lysine N-methyltransferase 4 [Mycena indigotica]
MDAVLLWFTHHGGTIDASSIGFVDFSNAGRGAVALRDIPENHILFKIPRKLLLSNETSPLPALIGLEQWRARKMHIGWAGLILCMLWEAAKGQESKWAPYLDSLPTTFDTPMFWSEGDLEELRGTSISDLFKLEKLGKADAEKDFHEKVLPLVQSRPDIFLAPTTFYTLQRYHIMGSRILSRSFDVEKNEEDNENEAANTSVGSAMDVDSDHPPTTNEHEETGSDGEAEDDEEDDSIVVSMVPLADMLNARYGSENAKLFYEKYALGMISTKPILAGEQIWNTYGDLPNAELLRRYGHVDLLPLDDQPGELGNPGDVVEIRADLVISAQNLSQEDTKERIDWWLEQGGDDVIVFEWDMVIPPALVALIRLLRLPPDEFAHAVEKDKVPKPKLDLEVLSVVITVLERRLTEYPTTLLDDLKLMEDEGLSINKKHALVVRIGEKRILQGALQKAMEARTAAEAASQVTSERPRKRKAGEETGRNVKTRKR